MKKLQLLLFLFLCWANQSLWAQKDNFYIVDTTLFHQLTNWERVMLDTFLVKIHEAKVDTEKVELINEMYSGMNDNDVWVLYLEHLNSILESNNIEQNYPYFYLDNKGKYYNDLGYYYKFKGLIFKAIDNYKKALTLREKQGINTRIATTLINIGSLYLTQDDYEKALENFDRGYELMTLEKDTIGMATALHNMGSIYNSLGNYELAIEKYKASSKLNLAINNERTLGGNYNSLGTVYLNLNQEDSAFYYLFKGLEERRKFNNILAITNSMNAIGNAYFRVGNIEKAKVYADSAFQLAEEIKYNEYRMNSSYLQYKVNKQKGNWKRALDMFEIYFATSDSIKNDATQKAAFQQQAQYEYEKQKAIDDAQHEKQIAIEQEAKEKQQIIIYATAGGLGLVAVFLFFVFNRLQVTRKQKAVIEEQKTEVEKAHHELEEKNQEILDSIAYAKRIQSAILPPTKLVKEYLPHSFILYKPKDIVAGDFYWMETITPSSRHSVLDTESANTNEIPHQPFDSAQDDTVRDNGLILFAAADCTGHGVPGAMVSVVCNNGLNRSVREHGLTDPGKILDKTREIVIAEFEKSEEEVKDGMDIALCSLKFMANRNPSPANSQQSTESRQLVAILEYAGANNPLWVIRPLRHSVLDTESSNNQEIAGRASNDEFELIEIKADKQPIGKYAEPKPYTTHTIELQKGDSIYIFSDGYVDQFGGEKGKKFKAKAFRELLLSIQQENMETQRELIDKAFEDWKGNLEQIDDVCVIGLRI
ncbi:MAG: tetratricopeptide repeat protein [Flavobacteriales bacterium]|nr:tetratricopeptide repeat protein [Flavobacteriales bacterium]